MSGPNDQYLHTGSHPSYTPVPQEGQQSGERSSSTDSDLDPRRYQLRDLTSSPSTIPGVGFNPSSITNSTPQPTSHFNSMRDSENQPQQHLAPPEEFDTGASQSYFRAISPTHGQSGREEVELHDFTASQDEKHAHAKHKKSMESVSSRLARKLSSRSRASARNVEEGVSKNLRRQRSLVRPERARPPGKNDPHYHSALRAGVVATPAGPASQVANKRTILTRENTLRRGRSIARRSTTKEKAPTIVKEKRRCPSPWELFSRVITFYAPSALLKCCGMKDRNIQQAWREKMALVTIIILLMGAVGFLTFGFQQVVCDFSTQEKSYIKYNALKNSDVVINGRVYDLSRFSHPATSMTGDDVSLGNLLRDPVWAGSLDLSFMFQYPNNNCKGFFNIPNPDDSQGNVVNFFPCVVKNNTVKPDPNMNAERAACHATSSSRQKLSQLPRRGDMYYGWDDINGPLRNRQFVIYSGSVLDMGRLDWLVNDITPVSIISELAKPSFRGRDVTYYISNNNPKLGRCLQEVFRAGALDTTSIGCMASQIVLYASLIVILGVVLIKFGLAVFFGWVMGRRLGQLKNETPEERRRRIAAIEMWSDVNNHYGQPLAIRPKYTVTSQPKRSRFLPRTSRYSTFLPGEEPGRPRPANTSSVYGSNAPRRASGFAMTTTANSSSHSLAFGASPATTGRAQRMSVAGLGHSADNDSQPSADDLNKPIIGAPVLSGDYRSDQSLKPGVPEMPMEMPSSEDLAYTILLVTCYSEGAHGIRTTLDSLAGTDFPTSHKCLFIICDGIITGAGESVSTPDVCLAMMKDFIITPDHVQPYSYVAIADGTKRHNMAKIYAGYYAPDDNSPAEAKRNRVPMILVVKCGTPAEADERKPGNRGKRDSQIILMSFLQHVMFDERMTELEYELFNAMWNVMGVTPDNFEIVLMVDADTKVYPDAVSRMVACMVRDPQVMGLCGETKIANKSDSWVSMIQVFEYYISHHQSKAFESLFGGVTCLPGCFCMYRIKAPKGPHGYWIPILANPDIVENYSENVVDTLHDKNLLLLGEDRYLSTLMLRTFPKRKMIFVPSAVCKTIVPDEFKVLLSQRRRWINSTVHNLMELVLVRDLCGTFCFSMQFVIGMELVGTVVLPAAISFTLYIVIISTFTRPVPWLPLMLLGIILGLPAILIGLTTRKLVYVGWMMIYLLSLPVWNFVLPVYAFWHFDDFSWGQTRMVQGEGKDKGHGDKDGEFDSSKIVMKRWCEFEAEKRRKTTLFLSANTGSLQSLGANGLPDVPPLPEGVPSQPSPLGGVNSNSSYNVAGSSNVSANASFDKLGYMTPQMAHRMSYAPSAQASTINLGFGSAVDQSPVRSAVGAHDEFTSSESSRSFDKITSSKSSEEPMLGSLNDSTLSSGVTNSSVSDPSASATRHPPSYHQGPPPPPGML
ncbi:hypothetical protein IWQ61_008591 [Dispira simplex]|nr:hypothetical protein IWQ61_008591 [Dispira simplex]